MMLTKIEAIKKIQRWYRAHRHALFSRNSKASILASDFQYLSTYEATPINIKNWRLGNFGNLEIAKKYNCPDKKIILFRATSSYKELEEVRSKKIALIPRLYKTALKLNIINQTDINNIKTLADNIKILQKIKNHNAIVIETIDTDTMETCIDHYDPRYRSLYGEALDDCLRQSPWREDIDTALAIYNDELSHDQLMFLKEGTRMGNALDPLLYFTSYEFLKEKMLEMLEELNSKTLIIILAIDPNERYVFRTPNACQFEWVTAGAIPYNDILDIVYMDNPEKSYLHEHENNNENNNQSFNLKAK